MNSSLRIALYLRVSTEEQRMHGLSIDAQKDILTKWVKDNNHIIVDYYEDAGITARKKMQHRKELLRLIEDVQQGKIDLIIFTKLDRWFRNIADYYRVQEIIDKHKVNWKTILEDYDTSTASGRLHINIMLSIAQDEADRTSERIKVVFKNKIEKGEPTNGSAAYGYKIVNGKLIVDKEKAERVKEIYNMYELKRSFLGTQKWYIEKYGVKISYEFISKMIKNEIYIGKKRDNSVFCEAIISVEQFNRVNQVNNESFSRLGKTGSIYLFSGLTICDTCKRMVNGITCYNPKPTKYYGCRGGTHHTTCTHNKKCRELKIERKALLDLDEYIETQNKLIKVGDITTTKVEASRPAEKDLVKRKMKRLKDLYVSELIDMDEYRRDYNAYKEQLEKVEKEEKENPINSTPSEIINFIKNSDYKTIYNKLDDVHKRQFWHRIIDKIWITDNNDIRIIFK